MPKTPQGQRTEKMNKKKRLKDPSLSELIRIADKAGLKLVPVLLPIRNKFVLKKGAEFLRSYSY